MRSSCLKSGEIAERGTHAALLEKNGLYASMWNRQREATQAEEHLKQVRESDDLGVVAAAGAGKLSVGTERAGSVVLLFRTMAVRAGRKRHGIAPAETVFRITSGNEKARGDQQSMSLLNTVRNTIVPVHKEGYVFVAAFFVASLVLGWIFEPLFWVGLVLTALVRLLLPRSRARDAAG